MLRAGPWPNPVASGFWDRHLEGKAGSPGRHRHLVYSASALLSRKAYVPGGKATACPAGQAVAGASLRYSGYTVRLMPSLAPHIQRNVAQS